MTIRRGPVLPGTCAGCGRPLKRPDPPRLVVAGFHDGGSLRLYTPGLDLAFCPHCWNVGDSRVALRDLGAILERAVDGMESGSDVHSSTGVSSRPPALGTMRLGWLDPAPVEPPRVYSDEEVDRAWSSLPDGAEIVFYGELFSPGRDRGGPSTLLLDHLRHYQVAELSRAAREGIMVAAAQYAERLAQAEGRLSVAQTEGQLSPAAAAVAAPTLRHPDATPATGRHGTVRSPRPGSSLVAEAQDKTRLWLESLTPGEPYALAAWGPDTVQPVYAAYIRPIYGYITSGAGTSFAELSEAERHLGHLRGLFGYLPNHPGNAGWGDVPRPHGVRMPPRGGATTFAIEEEDLYERVAARVQAAQREAATRVSPAEGARLLHELQSAHMALDALGVARRGDDVELPYQFSLEARIRLLAMRGVGEAAAGEVPSGAGAGAVPSGTGGAHEDRRLRLRVLSAQELRDWVLARVSGESVDPPLSGREDETPDDLLVQLAHDGSVGVAGPVGAARIRAAIVEALEVIVAPVPQIDTWTDARRRALTNLVHAASRLQLREAFPVLLALAERSVFPPAPGLPARVEEDVVWGLAQLQPPNLLWGRWCEVLRSIRPRNVRLIAAAALVPCFPAWLRLRSPSSPPSPLSLQEAVDAIAWDTPPPLAALGQILWGWRQSVSPVEWAGQMACLDPVRRARCEEALALVSGAEAETVLPPSAKAPGPPREPPEPLWDPPVPSRCASGHKNIWFHEKCPMCADRGEVAALRALADMRFPPKEVEVAWRDSEFPEDRYPDWHDLGFIAERLVAGNDLRAAVIDSFERAFGKKEADERIGSCGLTEAIREALTELADAHAARDARLAREQQDFACPKPATGPRTVAEGVGRVLSFAPADDAVTVCDHCGEHLRDHGPGGMRTWKARETARDQNRAETFRHEVLLALAGVDACDDWCEAAQVVADLRHSARVGGPGDNAVVRVAAAVAAAAGVVVVPGGQP